MTFITPLRFDDGGHIMIQLEQLEDAYQLGLFYTPEGGAELRFSP
jgi:hypothetical protein